MCDTFVAMPGITADSSVIFGKNSDREPNEAQSLEYHPGRTFAPNASVQCTYIQIPQIREKYATLISRPFWMWGAEIGVNEKGVVIGNEAVFTKMPVKKQDALTGMDLLRLALERSATAQTALETIVRFLADYGQGGICGYEDKKFAYHNSYIIADPVEAWVLETADNLWAAVKVNDYYAISNGLTIGEEFDESHPELISVARQKGLLKKRQNFHFARCFSDWFYTTFSGCRTRSSRASQLLQMKHGEMDVPAAIAHLRNHATTDYHPAKHFFVNSICSHSANKLSRHSAQSTGSLIAHLKNSAHHYWVTGTSAPCTGVFKPVAFVGDVLPDIGPIPTGTFHPEALWWQHEVLHRSVLFNYTEKLNLYAGERNVMETEFLSDFAAANGQQRWDVSRRAFHQARERTEDWIRRIHDSQFKGKAGIMYRMYWNAQNRKARMPVYE